MKQEIKKKINIDIRKHSLVDKHKNNNRNPIMYNDYSKLTPKMSHRNKWREVPKLISWINLPKEMFLINTVLFSNNETWQQLEKGSRG